MNSWKLYMSPRQAADSRCGLVQTGKCVYIFCVRTDTSESSVSLCRAMQSCLCEILKVYAHTFLTGSASNFSFFQWMKSSLIPSYRFVPTGAGTRRDECPRVWGGPEQPCSWLCLGLAVEWNLTSSMRLAVASHCPPHSVPGTRSSLPQHTSLPASALENLLQAHALFLSCPGSP